MVVYLILGSSSGIGKCFYESIRKDQNCTVHTMNRQKCGNSHTHVDFGDVLQIGAYIDDLKKKIKSPVNYLCIFAGVNERTRQTTVNNLEVNFQINCIAPVLFLMAVHDGNIIDHRTKCFIVGSRAGRRLSYDINRLLGSTMLAYSRSKFYLSCCIPNLNALGINIKMLCPRHQVDSEMNIHSSHLERFIKQIDGSVTPVNVANEFYHSLHDDKAPSHDDIAGSDEGTSETSAIVRFVTYLYRDCVKKTPPTFYNGHTMRSLVLLPKNVKELMLMKKTTECLNLTTGIIGNGCSYFLNEDVVSEKNILLRLSHIRDMHAGSNHTFSFSAGCNFDDCVAFMNIHNRTLRYMGSHRVQNIVGLISTGSHGVGNVIGHQVTKIEYLSNDQLRTGQGDSLRYLLMNQDMLVITRIWMKTVPIFEETYHVHLLRIHDVMKLCSLIRHVDIMFFYDSTFDTYITIANHKFDNCIASYAGRCFSPTDPIISKLHLWLREHDRRYLNPNLSIAVPMRMLGAFFEFIRHETTEKLIIGRFLNPSNILLAPNYNEQVCMVDLHFNTYEQLMRLWRRVSQIHPFKFHLGKYNPEHWTINRSDVLKEFHAKHGLNYTPNHRHGVSSYAPHH